MVVTNTISRKLEGMLRWLTESVYRSTAIFVVLTFVPILLLTYYIVASSIRSSKADALRGDAEISGFTVALLKTSFRSELEVLSGVEDDPGLHNVLRLAGPENARTEAKRQSRRQEAALTLARLHARHREFAWLAIYDATGARQAVEPADAPANLLVAGSDWFPQTLVGRANSISSVVRNGGAASIIFAIPLINDAAGQVEGVLAGALPTAVVHDWVQHVNTGADRYLYLIDRRRQLVAGPALVGDEAPGPIALHDAGLLPGVDEALGGAAGATEFISPIRLESYEVTYTPLPQEREALLLVRPVRFGSYFFRVFYDKLAVIALIVFLLAVASGTLLRAAFRYYQRYNREVESGKSKTEALLSSIGDGVFAVDESSRIIEFNRAAAMLTGLSPEEANGKPYTQVIRLVDEKSGEPAIDPVQQAAEQGRTFRFIRDVALVRRDGSRLPVNLTASPVMQEQNRVGGCVVVFNDASQEREVDRMKSEFISIASHQLRTPMSGVKGVLSLLLDEVLGALSAEQKEYLQRAYDANERLISLVNDLLNVGRIEQGKMQLRWEMVNLDEVLGALLNDYRVRAERYRQKLKWERVSVHENGEAVFSDAAAGDAIIPGDSTRLREVFANLIDNAIKYTPEGGTVTVRLTAQPDAVLVDVSDTGVGIPPEKIPALFQKFTRIPNPLSGREFSSGLGLYFAKSMVELHEGGIEASSELGAGTRFRVRLKRNPRARLAPRGGETGARAPAEAEPPVRSHS